VIGKLFGSHSLGLYNRGAAFPNLAALSVNGSIMSVLFPAIAQCQDERILLKGVARRTMRMSCFFVFPVMAGLAAIAEPFIRILLTEKWIGAVPFMQLCCLGYMLEPVHVLNSQVYRGLGRSDIYLKLEWIKALIGLSVVAASLPFGIYALVGGEVAMSLCCAFINGYPNGKLISYSLKEQWEDVLPCLALSIAMGVIVLQITRWGLPALPGMLLQIVSGVLIYIAGAYLFRLEAFAYARKALKEMRSARGGRSF
jgi:O-antigen/teichoic acid export membrane protein